MEEFNIMTFSLYWNVYQFMNISEKITFKGLISDNGYTNKFLFLELAEL